MVSRYRKNDKERPRLTKAWMRTLGMALSGRTNLEIAEAVGLKKPTIDSQLHKAYQALGVRNRMQAYHRAVALGLVTSLSRFDNSDSDTQIAQIDRTLGGETSMSATMLEPKIHTLEHGRHAFLKEVEIGVRCEIDETMFVYFLEVSPPIQMNCQVVLPGGRIQCAQYVTSDGDARRAFWIELERGNPGNCRYFAQNLPMDK